MKKSLTKQPFNYRFNRIRFNPRLTTITLAGLIISLLTSCSSTDTQQIVKSVTSGQTNQHIKKIIKDKESQYTKNPTQILKDVKSLQALYANLELSVKDIWGEKDVQLPNKKKYVKYTNSYQARAIIDFEKGTVRVETIAKKAAKDTLQQAIATTLLTPANPSEVDIFSDTAPKPHGKPHLYGQILDQDKKPIAYQWRANRFATYLVNHQLKTATIENHNTHYVELKLVEQHQHLRQEKYSEFVLASAKKYNIDPTLIYAIIETESSFNPFAVSHANAYGLMQVIPSTAGKDVYQRIKKRSDQPTKETLFKPQHNIDIGTAYLHMLETRYLVKVKNQTSRHYTVISAYNGGAGNVLKTFSSDRSKAMNTINTLSSSAIYTKLTQVHPKLESRRYLEKVTKAEKKY